MKIYDSHFHLLEMKKKDIDIDNFLNEWAEENAGYLIDIGVDETQLEERLNHSSKHSYLFHAVGIHPNSAGGDIDKRMNQIEESIRDRVIAIGETGLDYYWDKVGKETQQLFFKRHIELAIKRDLPIVVHNRDACEDIYSILKEYKGKLIGIIHCFSSSIPYLEKFLDLGFYISYAGNVTYKKNISLQETLQHIPLNRLLIETDSPYLSPTPKRGRLNTPFHLQYILQFISKVLNIESESLNRQICENYHSIFKLTGIND